MTHKIHPIHAHAHAPSHSHGHAHAHSPPHAHPHPSPKRASVFTKIFRWQTEKPGGPLPVRVEIAGSFTDWQKKPLKYDRANGIWQLTLENIPGHCTHNYMLLVNGRPTHDKNSDGLAIPHTEQEKAHQLDTPRGPRVFMLFSQTK
jgi:hypothetical protein